MKEIIIQSNILAERFGKEKRWVNWRLEKSKDGKLTKVPYYMKAKKASVSNPKTWKTHEQAALGFDNGSNKYSGIGIMLHDSKIICVDIDHVLLDGKIVSPHAEVILKLLKTANTFTEISQSGTGLHLFFEVLETFTPIANKKAPFEIYSNVRFIAVTNNSFDAIPLNIRTVTASEIEAILEIIGYPFGKELSTDFKSTVSVFEDSELLSKMFTSKNGDKIKSLYNGDISSYNNDDSSADSALCFHLAFWTGKNKEQMKRMWLASPLGQREKTQGREDYVDRTIANAINNCKEIYEPKVKKEVTLDSKKEKSDKKEPKDGIILKNLFERDDIVLFHDEKGETYISLEIDSHREVWSLKSKDAKLFLTKLSWTALGTTLKSEESKNVLSVLQAKARFEGQEIELCNRVAWLNGELYYDLTNSKYQVVKINTNGWEILDKAPTLFKRYPHQKSQFLPEQKGNIKLLLNYVTIVNEEHRLLFLVLVVSYFIPGFPHAMLVLYGAHGAAKTTTAKVARLLVDPSIMDVSTINPKISEAIQELAHHHFVSFDNISHLSEDLSDLLCKAISGAGFSKRELYTDDGDIIYRIQRCVAINGVNLVTTRPDLLDRSLLIELQRVDESIRKNEEVFYPELARDTPSILGGIFDVLVEAIKRRPNIKVRPERMADFTYWGAAIAEAIGYTQEEFLKAYRNNTVVQTEMLLNDNVVAIAIISFMEDKIEWKGTPSRLLDELYNQAHFENIDTREKYWPKGASSLSRKLNFLSTSFKKMGISIVISTSGTERYIHIQKIAKIEDSQIKPVVEDSQLLPDDTDDILEKLPL